MIYTFVHLMQKLLLSYCIAKNMNVTTDAQLFIKY